MMGRRLRLIPIATLLLYLVYGVLLALQDVQVIEPSLVARKSQRFFDYSGVTRVHTDKSSGSRPFEDVIAEAQETGLDFAIFSDINNFDLPMQYEGYHQNLAVLVGGEFSYIDSRILNVGGNTRALPKSPGETQVYFADRLSQKNRSEDSGWFVWVHPLKPDFRWAGEFPKGIDAMEIINLKAIWQNAWLNSRFSFIWTLLIYPFNPRLAFLRLFENPKRETELWDQLGQSRPRVGFASTDADARIRLIGGRSLEFPSYRALFQIVRNHLLLQSELTGQFDLDKKKITEALRIGQFYMSLDLLADPKGFASYVQDEKSNIYPLGSSVSLKSKPKLIVQLPVEPIVPYEIQIFRNGEKIHVSNSVTTTFAIIQPGLYRTVVRVIPTLPLPDGRKWLSWIWTNNVSVGI